MTKHKPMIKGIKTVSEFPSGYRWLGHCFKETEKAALFAYFSWRLWIPKSKAVRFNGSYACPAAMIESAKEFALSRAGVSVGVALETLENEVAPITA